MTDTSSPTRGQSLSTATAARAVVVPDKPALEGLAEKWTERWRAEETYALLQDRGNAFVVIAAPEPDANPVLSQLGRLEAAFRA